MVVFTINSYSTPPVAIKLTGSPIQIVIVDGAVTAPAFAVNPGVGNAFTLTNTLLVGLVHSLPLRLLTVWRL